MAQDLTGEAPELIVFNDDPYEVGDVAPSLVRELLPPECPTSITLQWPDGASTADKRRVAQFMLTAVTGARSLKTVSAAKRNRILEVEGSQEFLDELDGDVWWLGDVALVLRGCLIW